MTDFHLQMLMATMSKIEQLYEEINESIKKICDCFCMSCEDVAKAFTDMQDSLAKAEKTLRYSCKLRPPLKILKTYTYVAQNKKNLPYQRRNY